MQQFWRSPWRHIAQFALLICRRGWLMSLSTARLGYYWQWYRIPRYLFRVQEGRLVAGELIEGLLFTFRISGVSLRPGAGHRAGDGAAAAVRLVYGPAC